MISIILISAFWSFWSVLLDYFAHRRRDLYRKKTFFVTWTVPGQLNVLSIKPGFLSNSGSVKEKSYFAGLTRSRSLSLWPFCPQNTDTTLSLGAFKVGHLAFTGPCGVHWNDAAHSKKYLSTPLGGSRGRRDMQQKEAFGKSSFFELDDQGDED